VVAGDAVLLDRHLVSVGQFTDTARGISRTRPCLRVSPRARPESTDASLVAVRTSERQFRASDSRFTPCANPVNFGRARPYPHRPSRAWRWLESYAYSKKVAGPSRPASSVRPSAAPGEPRLCLRLAAQGVDALVPALARRLLAERICATGMPSA
jgi:hypothetical protein